MKHGDTSSLTELLQYGFVDISSTIHETFNTKVSDFSTILLNYFYESVPEILTSNIL